MYCKHTFIVARVICVWYHRRSISQTPRQSEKHLQSIYLHAFFFRPCVPSSCVRLQPCQERTRLHGVKRFEAHARTHRKLHSIFCCTSDRPKLLTMYALAAANQSVVVWHPPFRLYDWRRGGRGQGEAAGRHHHGRVDAGSQAAHLVQHLPRPSPRHGARFEVSERIAI